MKHKMSLLALAVLFLLRAVPCAAFGDNTGLSAPDSWTTKPNTGTVEIMCTTFLPHRAILKCVATYESTANKQTDSETFTFDFLEGEHRTRTLHRDGFIVTEITFEAIRGNLVIAVNGKD